LHLETIPNRIQVAERRHKNTLDRCGVSTKYSDACKGVEIRIRYVFKISYRKYLP
jgi:hypothetical protein